MTLFSLWARQMHMPGQAAVVRGQTLFNTKPISISGNTPNVGNHSVAAPLNIGIADASRHTPELPLYTLRNKLTGATVETTDPGRALITGKSADISKVKGPVLRGLAARAPYFHNGSAATLDQVVQFYNTRFNIGLSDQEHADLVAFPRTL
jgi:cytochrome c peroxidase